MYKIILLIVVGSIAFAAFQKHKQTTPGIGVVPKQIINKATDDLNQANAIAAEKMKAAEDATK